MDKDLDTIAQQPTAARLRDLLERADMAQRQAAREAGLHYNTLNYWLSETADHEPSLESLRKLFAVLSGCIDGLELRHVLGD